MVTLTVENGETVPPMGRGLVAAREFVEFCRGRMWVFTDAGTTVSGQRLYGFTHRTFLEYFAAKVDRSIRRGQTTAPYAWVIPHDQRHAGEAAALVNLFRQQGTEVLTDE